MEIYMEKNAMTNANTNFEIKKQMLALQSEIFSLRNRNAELESDFHKILDAIEKNGVLTIADMTKLAIARRLTSSAIRNKRMKIARAQAQSVLSRSRLYSDKL